ncbi:DUF4124 domain-containing protein [Rhodanobacter sp. B2A1Ga4]|uniref:DUF4124 domain-containing protein n=1 Tax=Rhodanobacter sp. B2A1Ga4 TaxID=2778647 RepID=UPI001FD1E364|nr:DUF4124 domain-containing protein [Rhodanobacter sp. B2A1Ga4]
MRWWLVAGLLVCAGWAHAGDIYTCKGTNGVNVYQNTPCPPKQPQLKHRQYDESMARAPSPQATEPQVVQQRVVQGQAPADGYANTAGQGREVAPAPTVAYQCTAGRRTWIQKTPCPSTYNQAAPVNVTGFTASGQHFTGNGWVDQRAPVREQSMDQSSLCDRVRAGANVGGDSEASRSYERNKIKRNLCGG